MRGRAGLISLALVAALGLIGLAASAARSQHWTSFTPGISARVLVATLAPGQQACETPVAVPSSVGGIEAWAWPAPQARPPIWVTVRDRHGSKLLATGELPPGYGEVPPSRGYPTPVSMRTRLSRTLGSGRRVSVCLQDVGRTPVTLMGSHPNSMSGTLRTEGKSTGHAAALVFLRPHSQSLFSMLPTIFRRASLFRPGWMGAWTFWLLGAALLGAFGVGALAVVKAAAADRA